MDKTLDELWLESYIIWLDDYANYLEESRNVTPEQQQAMEKAALRIKEIKQSLAPNLKK